MARLDKIGLTCYYVAMINSIKQKYYTFTPGEFLPIYNGNQLMNKRDFHIYKIKWMLKHRDHALYQFTHYAN